MRLQVGIFLIGAALGDCLTDQFSITANGNAGTPVICGENGGYHSKLAFNSTLEIQLTHVGSNLWKPWTRTVCNVKILKY